MIHKAEHEDIPTLAKLAVLLWPEHTEQALGEEFAGAMAGGAFFLAFDGTLPIGFAQCQLRHDYVEGTHSSPVGYLEGIFIRETHRHQGYAGQLLAACQTWAREQGCREFASDCELTNEDSLRFHLHMGFAEANRIICFTKRL